MLKASSSEGEMITCLSNTDVSALIGTESVCIQQLCAEGSCSRGLWDACGRGAWAQGQGWLGLGLWETPVLPGSALSASLPVTEQ